MTTGSDLPLVAMAIALLASTPVAACAPPEEMPVPPQDPTAGTMASVEQVYGLWAIRAVQGDERCRVSLSGQRDGAAYGALMERCTIPALADATGWRPVPGGFEVVGEGGASLMRFRMTGLDAFETVDGRFKGARSPEA